MNQLFENSNEKKVVKPLKVRDFCTILEKHRSLYKVKIRLTVSTQHRKCWSISEEERIALFALAKWAFSLLEHEYK